MASDCSDDIRYAKLIILLVKGGTFVAKKHILRISTSEQKCIDDILKDNKESLAKARQITAKQKQILFPRLSSGTDLECWDITLFSYILLNLCDSNLEIYEIDAIRKLREKRNDLAHAPSTTMPEGQFNTECGQLQNILLGDLSTRLSSAEQKEIDDIVNQVLTMGDSEVASYELKTFEWIDEFKRELESHQTQLVSHQTQLVSQQQELTDCCNRIGELETSKVRTNKQLVVMAKIIVSALTPLLTDRAQATLLEVLKQIVSDEQNLTDEQHQPGVDGVLTACRNLDSDMKDKGMVIDKVEEGSILITFRCLTISALKKISMYFVNRMYEKSVIELEHALSKYVESAVKLDMNIVLETLCSALTQIEKDVDNKSIVLTVTCRRPEGLQNAVNLFSNGSSTIALNSLAEALSASVGGHVELNPTIDGDQLKTIITELERQICLGENSLKRPTQTPYDVPTLRETPYEEPEHTETTSHDPAHTETRSANPTHNETRSDYLALPGSLSRSTMTGKSTHASTSPDTLVSTITRQKMTAGKHSLPTAIVPGTESCSKHEPYYLYANMTNEIWKWLEMQDLISECMQLKGRRATLHEIESCYSTDQLLDLLSEYSRSIKDLTLPLQLSELPCGCVSIDQKTIDQTTKTQPEYTIPVDSVMAAGCMTDMAYRVGKGELKNGFIVLPDIDKDDLHNMQQRGHLPFSCFAIAAKQMKEKLDMKRILILHLGYCPDIITQTATYADKDILYISIHEEKATGFVFKGGANECGSGNAEGFNVNIVLSHTTPPLPFTERGTLLAFRNIVMPIACQFNPEIVFVSIPWSFELALSHRALGDMITELMTLADGKVVVGQSFSRTYDDSFIALRALLGKVIPTIREEELHQYRDDSSLAETMRIQREYWPCLDEYQSLLEHTGQKKGTDCIKSPGHISISTKLSGRTQAAPLDQRTEKIHAKNTYLTKPALLHKLPRIDVMSRCQHAIEIPSSRQQTTHDEYGKYKPTVPSTSVEEGKEETSSVETKTTEHVV